jgi:hypothetical protein
MISKIKIEIKSHSETLKKMVNSKNQRKSTKRWESEKDHVEQNAEKLL